MKIVRSLFVLAILSLICITMSAPIAQINAQKDASAMLEEAFEAVCKAEEMGGDVKELIEMLNEAISLLEESEKKGDEELKNNALSIIEEVLSEAPKVGEEGAHARQTQIALTGVTIAILTILCIITWRYLPRLFWKLWIKTKGEWKVKV